MGIPRFREYGCEIQAFLGSLGLMQAFLGLGHPQIRETRLLMATLEDMKSVASSSNRGIAAAGIALNSKAADVRERLDRVQVFALGLAAMGAADKAQNGHIANATRSSHGRNLTVYLRRNNPGVIAALAAASVAEAAAKISTRQHRLRRPLQPGQQQQASGRRQC